MIVIAIIFAIVIGAEVQYLKKKQEKLTPYLFIYVVLVIVSEVLYFIRDKIY